MLTWAQNELPCGAKGSEGEAEWSVVWGKWEAAGRRLTQTHTQTRSEAVLARLRVIPRPFASSAFRLGRLTQFDPARS